MSLSLTPLYFLLSYLTLHVSSQQSVYSNSIVGTYTVTEDLSGVTLISKTFPWPKLPETIDTGNGPRGTQQGYNICNTSTVGPDSWCQTAYVNNISDFCIWGSPSANETVGDVEEEMVAYCTTPKWGTRVLQAGSLTGIYAVRTTDYFEVIGFIDQTAIGLLANDTGGEEDPHGADQRGNPMGSAIYTSAFGPDPVTGQPFQQAVEWNYFVGSGVFCMKVCNPASSNQLQMCLNTYDEVGCEYNMPAPYSTINGTFESCLGDDQLPVGTYVSNGVTSTWSQPATVITIPYTPAIPASSSCTTYQSAALFTALQTTTTTTTTSSSKTTGPVRSSTGALTSATASQTGSNNSGSKSGAEQVRIGGGVWGVVGAGVSAVVLGWMLVV